MKLNPTALKKWKEAHPPKEKKKPVYKKKEKPPEFENQFGIKFPSSLPEFKRRMYCARYNEGNVPQWEHFKWIGQRIAPWMSTHYWTDIRFKGLCEHSFTTWMGGGGGR